MKSARVAISLVAALLVAVPLGMLAFAQGYESWLASSVEAELRVIAEEALRTGESEWPALARRQRVELRLVEGDAVRVDTQTQATAAVHSFLGRVGAAIAATFGAEDDVEEPLDPAFADLESTPGFEERVSPQGTMSVFFLRVAHPQGGVLHVAKASRRGLRKLLPLTEELVRISAYQALLAIGVAFLLGRWLVKPLETLAARAKAYPREPLAPGELLDRGDEVGQLARSMSALADELEARRRATAELAADVAHELKNPLATIAASAELIGGARELTAERRALVEEQISLSVRRLRDTVDALLSLERLEAALPELPRKQVDLMSLARTVVDEYRRDARFSEWSFSVAGAASVETIAVPEAMPRLLRNLIDNALVQPSERKEIAVAVARERGAIELSVRDFGPGVAPGNRDKIFRRFFTQRPEGVAPGTGLGLSIVLAVAAAHGGTVRLDESVTPGACFVVTLPA